MHMCVTNLLPVVQPGIQPENIRSMALTLVQ